MHAFSFTQSAPEPTYQHKLLYRHTQPHPTNPHTHYGVQETPPKHQDRSNKKHNSSLKDKIQEQLESQRKTSREGSKVKHSPRKIQYFELDLRDSLKKTDSKRSLRQKRVDSSLGTIEVNQSKDSLGNLFDRFSTLPNEVARGSSLQSIVEVVDKRIPRERERNNETFETILKENIQNLSRMMQAGNLKRTKAYNMNKNTKHWGSSARNKPVRTPQQMPSSLTRKWNKSQGTEMQVQKIEKTLKDPGGHKYRVTIQRIP